jgi:hypothetical protein
LAELEAERSQRFAAQPKAPLSEYLYCHRSIVRSGYWTASDWQCTSECFDWTPINFPDLYVTTIQTYTAVQVIRTAECPYIPRTEVVVQVQNSKTLIARILLLRLEYLLET